MLKNIQDKGASFKDFGALFIFWESFIYSKLTALKGSPASLANLIYTLSTYRSWVART
jgi:hypothetical protein